MADQGKKKPATSGTRSAAGKADTGKADTGKADTGKADTGKGESAKPKSATPVYVGGDSLADRLMPHMKKIIAGIVVLGAVITIFFTYRWWTKKKAEQSTDHVIAALDDQRGEIVADQGSDAAKPPEAEGDDQAPTFASRADRASAVIADLAKANGKPREAVGLLEASQLLEAGRYDDAATAYRKLSSQSGLEGVLAREGLGFALEAKAAALTGDDRQAALADALAAFQAEQPDDAGLRREWALYHAARIQAQMGKKDDARAGFEQALDKAKEAGDKELEDMIQTRLVELDQPPIAEGGGSGSGTGTGTGTGTGAAQKPQPQKDGK